MGCARSKGCAAEFIRYALSAEGFAALRAELEEYEAQFREEGKDEMEVCESEVAEGGVGKGKQGGKDKNKEGVKGKARVKLRPLAPPCVRLAKGKDAQKGKDKGSARALGATPKCEAAAA